MKKYTVWISNGMDVWVILEEFDDWNSAIDCYLDAQYSRHNKRLVYNYDIKAILLEYEPDIAEEG